MNFLRNLFTSRFFVIFLLTFVNGLSMTMLFPVLPFIVKAYGEPEVVLWILLWTFSLFQFIAAPILWALSDSYGRKPVLILTQAGTLLSWVILGIAYVLPSQELFWFVLLPILVVFLSRAFDGITWGNASVAQAVLADMSEPEDRSKVFWMNGAVFGMALLVWPALGSFSVSSSVSFLWTAILWAIISAVTLAIMMFALDESLPEDKREKELTISFRKLNVFAQIMKWWKIPTVRYAIIMKVFMFISFVWYTSITALYLIDVFGFSASSIWYYLTFTGSFLIFHQAFSIRYFLKYFGDRKSLLIAFALMWFGWICMGTTMNIALFTVFYFFAVMGISLGFTTLWALFSRSADSSKQGEIMWMSAWLESLISIGAPIIMTLLYTLLPFSIYYIIWWIPFIALWISLLFCRNIKYPKNS
jgi:DHA1 family tetracycline resistance protein-like MFS transporter